MPTGWCRGAKSLRNEGPARHTPSEVPGSSESLEKRPSRPRSPSGACARPGHGGTPGGDSEGRRVLGPLSRQQAASVTARPTVHARRRPRLRPPAVPRCCGRVHDALSLIGLQLGRAVGSKAPNCPLEGVPAWRFRGFRRTGPSAGPRVSESDTGREFLLMGGATLESGRYAPLSVQCT